MPDKIEAEPGGQMTGSKLANTPYEVVLLALLEGLRYAQVLSSRINPLGSCCAFFGYGVSHIAHVYILKADPILHC